MTVGAAMRFLVLAATFGFFRQALAFVWAGATAGPELEASSGGPRARERPRARRRGPSIQEGEDRADFPSQALEARFARLCAKSAREVGGRRCLSVEVLSWTIKADSVHPTI